MLGFSHNGKVAFQQYAKETISEHVGIEITNDIARTFHEKYLSSSVSRVSSLYKTCSYLLIDHLTSMITEMANIRMESSTGSYKISIDNEVPDPNAINDKDIDLQVEQEVCDQNKMRMKFWNLISTFLKDSLPLQILDDLETGVLHKIKNIPHIREFQYREILKYLHWKLFFPIIKTSTHLKLLEFLSWGDHHHANESRSSYTSWSGLAFYFLTNEYLDVQSNNQNSSFFREQEATWATKLSLVERLTLGTSRLDDGMEFENSFRYEANDDEWKMRLAKLLKNLPNLSEIILLNGFCDDDVISLIGKNCDRCKILRIRICCEDFECADPERLTDEGMCEFIDRFSGSYGREGYEIPDGVPPATLTHLDLGDCHYPNITAKTISSLGKLRNLERVDLRLMHFQWGELFSSCNNKHLDKKGIHPGAKTPGAIHPGAKTPGAIHPGVLCSAKTLCLSVGQTSVYHQINLGENKGNEILDRFTYVLRFFPFAQEIHLREVYGERYYTGDDDSHSLDVKEFEKLRSVFKMATSLNLFKDASQDLVDKKQVIKSLHLKGGLIPVSTHTYSTDGTKIVKNMDLIKTVESLHLQDFSYRWLMGIDILQTFENITKIFISYGFGYQFLMTFPLLIVLKLIFTNVKSLEDLQMIRLNISGGGDTIIPLMKDDDLKDLIEDKANSRIKNNLRVFVLSADTSEDFIGFSCKPTAKLGLTLEKSAILLQKSCPNIQKIGCLKSWSTSCTSDKGRTTLDDDPNPMLPLEKFLLPNFKVIQTSRNCDCLENFNKPCCIQTVSDLSCS